MDEVKGPGKGPPPVNQPLPEDTVKKTRETKPRANRTRTPEVRDVYEKSRPTLFDKATRNPSDMIEAMSRQLFPEAWEFMKNLGLEKKTDPQWEKLSREIREKARTVPDSPIKVDLNQHVKDPSVWKILQERLPEIGKAIKDQIAGKKKITEKEALKILEKAVGGDTLKKLFGVDFDKLDGSQKAILIGLAVSAIGTYGGAGGKIKLSWAKNLLKVKVPIGKHKIELMFQPPEKSFNPNYLRKALKTFEALGLKGKYEIPIQDGKILQIGGELEWGLKQDRVKEYKIEVEYMWNPDAKIRVFHEDASDKKPSFGIEVEIKF